MIDDPFSMGDDDVSGGNESGGGDDESSSGSDFAGKRILIVKFSGFQFLYNLWKIDDCVGAEICDEEEGFDGESDSAAGHDLKVDYWFTFYISNLGLSVSV